MKKQKSVIMCTGGGGPAEPTAERYPRLNPSKNLAKHVLDPSGWSTKELSMEGVKQPSLRADASRRGNPPAVEPVPRDDRGVFARVAFTMAEILLSLTIIGVVAAITLPSLTGNINERTWATQKKALYARMSQAFPLLDSINTYDDAESFIAGALNTVTKINNVCSGDNIEDCGLPTTLSPLNATSVITSYGGSGGTNQYWSAIGVTDSMLGDLGTVGEGTSPSSRAATDMVAAFETGNGESIVLMYNPNCVPDQETSPKTLSEATGAEEWFKYVCVNMVYDLNSNKGPNTFGKDIGFMTVFYPTDSVVVSVVPDLNTSSYAIVGGSSSPSVTCASGDEYRAPNKFEAISMALNNKFMSGTNLSTTAPTFITSTKGADSSNTYVYKVEGTALKTSLPASATGSTRCVKR